jgi:hypothetical protein
MRLKVTLDLFWPTFYALLRVPSVTENSLSSHVNWSCLDYLACVFVVLSSMTLRSLTALPGSVE